MVDYKKFLIIVVILISWTSTLLHPQERTAALFLKEWWNKGPMVNVEETETDKLKFTTGAILINAPIDKVWNILTDTSGERLKDPYILSTRIIEKSKDRIVVEATAKIKLLTINVTVKTVTESKFDKSKYRINFKMIKGDYRKSEGFWELKPFGKNKTLVFYGNYTDISSIPIMKSLMKVDPAVETSLSVAGILTQLEVLKERAEK